MIKILALVFMTIDHFGHYFYGRIPMELYLGCRLIGRLAFPIYAYLTALGYRRTRNFFRYFLRLFILAIPTQIIIGYAKGNTYFFDSMNVLFTLAMGVLAIIAYEIFSKGNYDRLIRMQPIQEGNNGKLPWQFRFNLGFEIAPVPAMILGIAFLILALYLATYFDTDYSAYGVITILLFHLILNEDDRQEQKQKAIAYLSLFNLFVISTSQIFRDYRSILPKPQHFFTFSALQGFSILAIFIIYWLPERLIHSEERPPAWQKYFFYAYYPLHILLLVFIRDNIWPK